MRRLVPGCAFAWGVLAWCTPSLAADPPAVAATASVPVSPPLGDLQSPEQVSTRYSAYSLPRGMWAFNLGALGIGGGDAFAEAGAAYGLGAGLELSTNLAHAGVGLFNLSARFQFIDTRYFDLGASVGAWYGHGGWFWVAQGYTKQLIAKIDVVSVPLLLTASAPLTKWLELDLGAQYTYASLFGANSDQDSLFSDAELGLRQLFVRPGVRLFVSGNTSLEVSAKLPLTSTVPLKHRDVSVPFSEAWSGETGLRSLLTPGFFGNIRLHYSKVATAVYGTRLYPSFELELRL